VVANARNALREGTDAAILTLLEGDMTILNSDRGALQVIGLSSRDILLSIGLPGAQDALV
jgi:hypothetical protein